MKLNIGLFNESFPPTIDGVSNCVFNYATYIKQNHGDCTVVTPKYPRVKDDYAFNVYRYSSADLSKNIGYRVGNMFSMRTLRDLYCKKFDIIHVHSPFASSVIAAEVKKLDSSIPVVFTYHTKFDIDFSKRLKVKTLCTAAKKFVCHNISQADEVWVVSEGAAQSLRNIGYKGPYRVMKNGTDFARGKADSKAIKALKAEYGIAKDEKVMLFVGRMMWYKNTGLILDALKLLPDDMKYKMIFVGDGVDRPAIEQYAKELGLDDKTIFTGAVHDREKVRTFFSASNLFLFPSTYDTAGLVVMEAAACDLPSVLIDGSCAAEDVVDDFSGFLCSENAQSLCNKLIYAFADEQRLLKIGKNAGEYVYLSWEDAVAKGYKRYCELYNEYHRHSVKKSLIEKALPSNIKHSITSTAITGKKAVKNAGKKIGGVVYASKKTAGGVVYASKKAAGGVTSASKKAAGGVVYSAKTTKNAALITATGIKSLAEKTVKSIKNNFSANDIKRNIDEIITNNREEEKIR